MKLDLNKYDSLKGCLLEIDFKYHNELHNLQFAHENIESKRDVLSDYCLRGLEVCCNWVGGVKKLVPNFYQRKMFCSVLTLDCIFKTTNEMKKFIDC